MCKEGQMEKHCLFVGLKKEKKDLLQCMRKPGVVKEVCESGAEYL